MPQEPPTLTIRPASIADAALITRLISECAEFDNALREVITTEADVLRDGFGADPHFRALIAGWLSGPAVFAVFWGCDSTWRGAGFCMEDLFVCRRLRRRGIGTSLPGANRV